MFDLKLRERGGRGGSVILGRNCDICRPEKGGCILGFVVVVYIGLGLEIVIIIWELLFTPQKLLYTTKI